MNKQKKLIQISGIVVFVLILSAIVLPGPGTAIGPTEDGGWFETQAAQIETSLGRCPDGQHCEEWCQNGEGTGDFMCFY